MSGLSGRLCGAPDCINRREAREGERGRLLQGLRCIDRFVLPPLTHHWRVSLPAVPTLCSPCTQYRRKHAAHKVTSLGA